jgi:uncharacterized membrane protein YfcA
MAKPTAQSTRTTMKQLMIRVLIMVVGIVIGSAAAGLLRPHVSRPVFLILGSVIVVLTVMFVKVVTIQWLAAKEEPQPSDDSDGLE